MGVVVDEDGEGMGVGGFVGEGSGGGDRGEDERE